MNELTLDGKIYVSSKRAAEITGYAKDYVGQLCREGHVEARLVGRSWYVLEDSIKAHRFGKEGKGGSSVKAKEYNAKDEWKSPRYISEESDKLPDLAHGIATRMEEELKESLGEAEKPARGAILTDMESAWQEWFTKKPSERQKMPHEATSVIEEEESAVEIEPARSEQVYEVPIIAISESREPEEVSEEGALVEHVQRERPLERQNHRRRGVRTYFIQASFVAAALLAVTVALIGTGYAAKFTSSGIYRLSEINFLAGVDTISK